MNSTARHIVRLYVDAFFATSTNLLAMASSSDGLHVSSHAIKLRSFGSSSQTSSVRPDANANERMGGWAAAEVLGGLQRVASLLLAKRFALSLAERVFGGCGLQLGWW